MPSALAPARRRLLEAERRLLARLEAALPASGASDNERSTIADSRRELEDLFLLVVVGEFNSGKSALINALLGRNLLAEGATPTTARLHVLRWGETETSAVDADGIVQVGAPIDWLRDLRLVDTPGTNAVLRDHQRITEEFVPRADLVLFITSADRPWSESERAFLQEVRDWGKKVVVVVNKIDILESDETTAEVVDFVRRQAVALLGVEPPVFPLSVRRARQGREDSRFAALVDFLRQRLDEEERFRLKLANPLGVAARLGRAAVARVTVRLEALRGDIDTLESIDRQLGGYAQDLRQDFALRLARIDNLLHDLRARGDRFLDETVRLGRLFDLLNAARVRAAFEREVVGDVHAQLETEVSALVDWMIERNHRQWKEVVKILNRQATSHRDRLVGEIGGDFEINRQELLASIGRAARAVASSYDKETESLALTESIQLGLAAVGAVEVGAFGLGAVLLHALTRALDPLGVLAAGGLAVLGLYILPARRRAAQRDLETKIAALRQRLAAALTTQFERETERAVQTLREAISPYTRFVRTERERLAATQGELETVDTALGGLRAELGVR